jgi:hypothetical protein
LLIVVFFVAEKVVGVLPGFRVRPPPVPPGLPTTTTKAKLFRETGSAFQIARCGQWMISGEFPAGTILVLAQSVACEVPPECLAAPAAFEANYIIAMNRSPDGDGGGPINLGFCCRFSESRERCMHGRDQRREFVGPDLVSPNISSDDVCREVAVE